MTFEMSWSKREKEIARRAFDAAHEREYRDLLHKTREMANRMQEPGDLWRLHDFLRRTLKDVDEKYDYRYSVLILVFARLVREGWLSLKELEGLGEDKREAIDHILAFAREQSHGHGE